MQEIVQIRIIILTTKDHISGRIRLRVDTESMKNILINLFSSPRGVAAKD
jgi:hypothetical protein